MARTSDRKRAQRGKARWKKTQTAGKLRSRKLLGFESRNRHSRPRLPLAASEKSLSPSRPQSAPESRSHSEVEKLELDFELAFEADFFASRSPAVAYELLPVDLDEPVEEMLTPAEHERRLRLRRQVAQLIAVLAAFTVFAVILRMTQSG